jgi:hypothetical protein
MTRILSSSSLTPPEPQPEGRGTYLNGVGSFRLRNLRGLLIVLMALLA